MCAKAFSLPANNTILLHPRHPSNAESTLASVDRGRDLPGPSACILATQTLRLRANPLLAGVAGPQHVPNSASQGPRDLDTPYNNSLRRWAA